MEFWEPFSLGNFPFGDLWFFFIESGEVLNSRMMEFFFIFGLVEARDLVETGKVWLAEVFFFCVSSSLSQFDNFEPKEKTKKLSFFNWWTFSIFFGTLFANTILLYVQDNVGWSVGYGLTTAELAILILIFLVGTPFYRHKVPTGSPFTSMSRVLVAAIRKWRIPVPSYPKELYELDMAKYAKKRSLRIDSTPSLRFLVPSIERLQIAALWQYGSLLSWSKPNGLSSKAYARTLLPQSLSCGPSIIRLRKMNFDDEKQRLKARKRRLEQQVKAMTSQKASCLTLTPFQPHLLLKLKHWQQADAIHRLPLEFPCGKSCHCSSLIPPRDHVLCPSGCLKWHSSMTMLIVIQFMNNGDQVIMAVNAYAFEFAKPNMKAVHVNENFRMFSSFSEHFEDEVVQMFNSKSDAEPVFLPFLIIGGIENSFIGSPYTWTNNQQGCRKVFKRLDRALCTAEWRSVFPNALLKHLPTKDSAHKFLPLGISPGVRKFRKPFRFEAMWFSDPTCKEVISEAMLSDVHGSPSYTLYQFKGDTKSFVCAIAVSRGYATYQSQTRTGLWCSLALLNTHKLEPAYGALLQVSASLR
ncbi:hypothetical protein IFM89_033574 [Coptis chinensis]|uniref:Uncharacterized protein n=1 Tax=Coptis chinensis TaxID=261450 RepID=A0A835I2T2_9MAGN|nr:hypothetical protein IFM89_033574 [Coptis chinensis]